MSFQLYLKAWTIGVLGTFVVLALFGESGRLRDLAANDVTCDDDEGAEEKRNPPAPGHEFRLGQEMRERQEDRRGEDLAGLHALEAKAGVVAAPAERSVLENHRTCAGNLPGNREALDQTKDDEKQRRQQADLLVGRQERHGHRRETHEKHTQDQHGLTAVGIAPVAEEEGADRPGNVADAVGRQRRDDGNLGVA